LKKGSNKGPVRKWARRIGIGILVLTGLILVLTTGAALYIATPSGGERIRALTVRKVNEAIRGELGIRSLTFHWNHIQLHGVSIKDPEGNLVAQLESLDLRFTPSALLRRVAQVEVLQLNELWLHLISDASGINLLRAIEPSHPSPPKSSQPKPTPLRITVKVERLEINGATLIFEQPDAGPVRELELKNLNLRASAGYESPSQRANVELSATGDLSKPEPGPIQVSLQGVFDGVQGKANASLSFAGLALEASAEQSEPGKLAFQLSRLDLPPKLAKIFVPKYPLKAVVSLRGEGALDGNLVAASVQLRAARARLDLEGSVDLARYRSDGITVRARDVHLDELIASGPTTNLSLDLHAEGAGTNLANARGTVQLAMPISKWGKQQLGPIRLRAKADRDTFEVNELFAVLPGARLEAAGRSTRRQLSANATITVADLSESAHALSAILGARAPRLGGAGKIDVSAKGTIRQLAISAVGRFPRLRFEEFEVRKLDFALAVPDLEKPLASRATIEAETIQVRDKVFSSTAIQLAASGRDLDLQVHTSGFLDAAMRATGRVDPDQRGVLLSVFTLAYPGADWVLQKPSKLRFASEHLSAEDLWLRSENQTIRINGSLERNQVHATVDLVQLDLGQIPIQIFAPTLKIRGLLNVHIAAQGAFSRPDAVAHVDLQNGQFKQYRDLSLLLDAKYQRLRASGELTASAFGTGVTANFDFSPQGVLQHDSEPLHLLMTVQKVDLSQILTALGRKDPLRGTVASRIELSGTGADPLLNLTVNGEAIEYAKLPPLKFSLAARSAEKGALTADLDWQIQSSTNRLSARSSLTLARLAKGIPRRAELLRLPLSVDADIRELPLSLLNEAGLVAEEVQGKLSVAVQIKGSAAAPTGKVNLALSQAGVAGLAPSDLTLVATGSAKGFETSFNVQREGRRLVDAAGWIHGPLTSVESLDALAAFPLSLKLTAGPIRLEGFRSISGSSSGTSEGPPTQPLGGLLMAEFSLTGTLGDPKATLRSQVDQVSAGSQAVGKLKLDLGYERANANASALLTSSAGGQMQIQGGMTLDLSLPAIRRGLAFRTSPVHASLLAKDFDISFLSGVIPNVRVLSGTLIADAEVGGTIGVPSLHGDLEWKTGRIAILGFGAYQQIHLMLSGDTQHIQLKELTARSGEGNLKLTANANRNDAGVALDGRVDLSQFPIFGDDQLVATVTTNAQFDGEITHDLINVRRLSIPRAQIDLPESSPKSLQSLSRPDDIVVLRRGEPLDKQIARAMAAKQGNSAGFGGAGSPQGTRSREINIAVDAPRNLWVKGSDVNVELGLSEGFHVTIAQQTTIFGDVRVLRGRVDVLGRRFDIQQGSDIRFAGPPTSPYLNVTAAYNNEREQVKVLVSIRGQGKDITITPSSEPPLSESEIYTLIATGRRYLRQNSGATSSTSGQATSIIGSLAANQLRKSLSSKLPLDVLSIEAGQQGLLTGAKLEAGHYFGDKVYIGYVGRYGADPSRGENSNAVRLEYQFTPRWEFDGEYGDARAGSADIVWFRNY